MKIYALPAMLVLVLLGLFFVLPMMADACTSDVPSLRIGSVMLMHGC